MLLITEETRNIIAIIAAISGLSITYLSLILNKNIAYDFYFSEAIIAPKRWTNINAEIAKENVLEVEEAGFFRFFVAFFTS